MPKKKKQLHAKRKTQFSQLQTSNALKTKVSFSIYLEVFFFVLKLYAHFLIQLLRFVILELSLELSLFIVIELLPKCQNEVAEIGRQK